MILKNLGMYTFMYYVTVEHPSIQTRIFFHGYFLNKNKTRVGGQMYFGIHLSLHCFSFYFRSRLRMQKFYFFWGGGVKLI